MGSSPARGKHASPRTGVLPSFALPVARARHGRASHGPTSAVLLAATAGGFALTVALPGTSSVSAQAASATTVLPSAGPLPSASAPSASTLSASALAARQELADRASRSRRAPLAAAATPFRAPAVSTPSPAAAPLLPGCTGTPSTDGYANGRLPDRVLCAVADGERLRADAARAFAALAVAYESRFGTRPCLIDGYRTLGEQQVLRRTKRRFAAPPGTSEHGWGLAVDLGCGAQARRSAQHAWLAENAGRFGWVNPEWAQPGGSKPEPWHWEFGVRD